MKSREAFAEAQGWEGGRGALPPRVGALEAGYESERSADIQAQWGGLEVVDRHRGVRVTDDRLDFNDRVGCDFVVRGVKSCAGAGRRTTFRTP